MHSANRGAKARTQLPAPPGCVTLGGVPTPLRILATGSFLPSRVVTSTELDERFDRTPGESQARSGVSSRRWVTEGDTSSAMAAAALGGALAGAGLEVADLDAVLVSAVAPEQPMPTTAILTLAALGAEGGRHDAFDVNASCVGFLTAMRVAQDGISAGRWRRVGVVATEIASKGLDHSHTEMSALFGDGAAAAVLSGEDVGDSCVLASRSLVWPAGARACQIQAGGTRWNAMTPPEHPGAYLFQMDGAALLRQVARHLPAFLRTLEAEAGIAMADVDLVIPHQASGVGLRFLAGLVSQDRIVDILADHGNQVSASLPTALNHAVWTGRLRRGDTALLLGTGAGLTLSATVLRF